MSQSIASTFGCPGCGKTWTWKPTIAGRVAKCGCGRAFPVPREAPAGRSPQVGLKAAGVSMDPPTARLAPTAPAAQPLPPLPKPLASAVPPEEQESDDLYSLAPAERIPTPRPIPEGPSLTTLPASASALTATASGRILNYRTSSAAASAPAARRGDEALGDIWEGNKVKNLYVPLILIAVSILLTFAVTASISHSAFAASISTTALAVVWLIVEIPILLIACVLGAKMMGVAFGPIFPALLKLSSIALAPNVVLTVVSLGVAAASQGHGRANVVANGMVADMFGRFLRLIVYYALFMYYFSLEVKEVLVITIISWVLNFALGIMIAVFFVGMLLHH